ncbi:hypothetical protein CHARACLAT_017038 [Characodon lateralis]|uniref:Uncharacterized protein n=1 Tax=Characodon lateralis TaxID=208331 RepID=A0ABU7E1W5_9TELE|nr:hypothetical protein [Characodon lateralis]
MKKEYLHKVSTAQHPLRKRRKRKNGLLQAQEVSTSQPLVSSVSSILTHSFILSSSSTSSSEQHEVCRETALSVSPLLLFTPWLGELSAVTAAKRMSETESGGAEMGSLRRAEAVTAALFLCAPANVAAVAVSGADGEKNSWG